MARLPARLRVKPRITPKGGVQKPHRPKLREIIQHPEWRNPKRVLIGKGSPREGMSEREIREKFVERALRMGAGSIPQLAKFTDLSEERIRQIEEDLRFKLRAAGREYSEKSLKVRQIERMLIEGELTGGEIAKRTGVSRSRIRAIRWELKEGGIPTKILKIHTPPKKIARRVLELEVLMQLSGKSPWACIPIAEVLETKGWVIAYWIKHVPEVFMIVRTFSNGGHWKRAHEQLKDWIEEREGEEQYRGKKYNPNISLTVELAKKRMRAMKAKK